MARITASDRYQSHYPDCALDDCERRYCRGHRQLWRDCDTAEPTSDGAGQTWYEVMDCPECMAEARYKRMMREVRHDAA